MWIPVFHPVLQCMRYRVPGGLRYGLLYPLGDYVAYTLG